MKINCYQIEKRSASTLTSVLVFTGILGMGVASILQTSSGRLQATQKQTHFSQAFYHSENLLSWACTRIEAENISEPTRYSSEDQSLELAPNAAMKPETVRLAAGIVPQQNGLKHLYSVTTAAEQGNEIRSLRALVRKNPPSEVFDYVFCLNNRGVLNPDNSSFHGSLRFNWDAHVETLGQINGHLIAAGEISGRNGLIKPAQDSVSIPGQAGNAPAQFIHMGAEKARFPTLKNLEKYRELAKSTGGKLTQGGSNLVNMVWNDSAKPGIFLEGNETNILRVEGVVVIEGDLVIQGQISGIGTIIVGGNLYIGGHLIYANGPDFSAKPEIQKAATRDEWVLRAVKDKKDLVAFVVRESIFCGQINNYEWKKQCYYPEDFGLQFRGAESALGQDGIAGTADDSKPYKHPDGNSSTWNDIDQDGAVDVNFDFLTHIKLNSARARKIHRYPVNKYGTPESYNEYSSNQYNRLDGIFFTEHAFGLRSTVADLEIHGSVIARDEAIVFKKSLNMIYDPRIHSRCATDPERFVDLHLPGAYEVQVLDFAEIEPQTGLFSQSAQ